MMDMEITEVDYERALGSQIKKQLTITKKESILGDQRSSEVLDLLPKVIADRVSRMIPDDFEIKEISIKVAVSGSPFGVGVNADANVKFARKNTK
jgi:hypothetical protein